MAMKLTPELIDKSKVLQKLCAACYNTGSFACISCEIPAIIKGIPTIQSEQARQGRWVVHTTWHGMFGLIHSECSECKFDRNGDLSSWKFCPNCGAKMGGGVNNGS